MKRYWKVHIIVATYYGVSQKHPTGKSHFFCSGNVVRFSSNEHVVWISATDEIGVYAVMNKKFFMESTVSAEYHKNWFWTLYEEPEPDHERLAEVYLK